MTNLLKTIAVRGLMLIAALGCFGADTALAAPERRALLIGINEYASPKVVDLRGAVNDVKMLRRILVSRFGFDEQNITTLVDEQATRDALLAAIDAFVDETDDDDTIYFHYSGHGSRIKDRNGDEGDEFDETILPHDARMPGIPDIVDDELDRRFARIKSENVLIVFDSCYAGTVTRAASAFKPRAMQPDSRDELYKEIATRAVVEVDELPHVLMTGAPADKQALDGPVDEGFFGLFSYSLARSLETNGPDATPQDVHEVVKTELQRIREQLYTSPPEPQLEGPRDRLQRPILPIVKRADKSAVSLARRTWLDVKPYAEDKLLLVDGIEMNARPGSQWGLYGPGETRFIYGNALALGSVERIEGNDAILALQYRRAPVPADARAIALAPPDPGNEIRIRMDGPDAERRNRLMSLIGEQLPGVRLAGPEDFARFVISLDANTWRVKDAGGLQPLLSMADGADNAIAGKLVRALSRSSRALSLLALDNPASDMKLSLQVSNAMQTYRIRKDGDERTDSNSLLLEVEANRDVFITIVDVDAEGGINVLFPNDYQDPDYLPDGLVRANSPVRIPDALTADNEAGFHWDLSPPKGKDTIRVFASTSLETAMTIREFVRGARQRPGELTELRTALATRAARGVRVVADVPTDDWAAASVTLEVKE